MKAAGSTPPASALSTPAASGASTLGPTPAASLPPPEPNGPCPAARHPRSGRSLNRALPAVPSAGRDRPEDDRLSLGADRCRGSQWPTTSPTPHRRPRWLAGTPHITKQDHTSARKGVTTVTLWVAAVPGIRQTALLRGGLGREWQQGRAGRHGELGMGMSGSLQIGRAIPIADVQANGTQYPLSALIAGAANRGPRSAMADGGQAMSE